MKTSYEILVFIVYKKTMADWTVKILRQALKKIDRLPAKARESLLISQYGK